VILSSSISGDPGIDGDVSNVEFMPFGDLILAYSVPMYFDILLSITVMFYLNPDGVVVIAVAARTTTNACCVQNYVSDNHENT
jgi:hypothetical protein